MQKNGTISQLRKHPVIKNGIWLVMANMVSNVINMLTSIIVGRSLSLEYFGIFNIFSSLVFFAGIGLSALASSINYQTSYISGKYNLKSIYQFWKIYQRRALKVMIVLSLLWVGITPWLPQFLNVPSSTPFILFTAFLLFSTAHSISEGYLSGRMMFHFIAILSLIQTITRLLAAYVFVTFQPEYTYVALLVGVICATFVSTFIAKKDVDTFRDENEFTFSASFFLASMVTGLSAIAFFSLDNLLVAHYFDPETVGLYGLLGLVGKMIFFVATLILTFLMPLVARNEGSNKESNEALYICLGLVSTLATSAYAFFIYAYPYIGELLFKENSAEIFHFLPAYGLGVVFFCISQVFSIYYLSKKQYAFPLVSLCIAVLQVVSISKVHENLEMVVTVMLGIGLCNLSILTFLHLINKPIAQLQHTLITKLLKKPQEVMLSSQTFYSFTPLIKAKLITLQSIYDEGSLHICELKKHIDFEMKRFYVIKDVITGAVRGHHAHHRTQQCLFCISGSATIILDNGREREAVTLTHPGQGVYLDPMVWHEMVNFTPETVLLVIASETFSEADYIRNYQEFLKLCGHATSQDNRKVLTTHSPDLTLSLA